MSLPHETPETASDGRMHVLSETCWCRPRIVHMAPVPEALDPGDGIQDGSPDVARLNELSGPGAATPAVPSPHCYGCSGIHNPDAAPAVPSLTVERLAREFVEDHDGGNHADATWPCDGRCIHARRLRAALATPEGTEPHD